MSGLASVLLAFSASFSEYVVTHAKAALWIAAALCFIVTSYRVWAKERERNEPRLTFEIDPKGTWTQLLGDQTDANAFVYVKLHFRNSDLVPRVIELLDFTLHKKDTSGHIKDVPVLLVKPTFALSSSPTDDKLFRGLTIQGLSDDYDLCTLVSGMPGKDEIIAGSYFLRLTLFALAQLPYSVDLYADWNAAQDQSVHTPLVSLNPHSQALQATEHWASGLTPLKPQSPKPPQS